MGGAVAGTGSERIPMICGPPAFEDLRLHVGGKRYKCE